MTTSRYVPADYFLLDQNEELGLEVYGRTIGKICAICYTGKRHKSDWHFSFLSLASLEEKVRQTITGLHAAQERKKQRALERNAPHRLQVGDLMLSVWGYDQTNIDYFEVTPIRQTKTYDNAMSGDCLPLLGSFIGEPVKRKVSMIGGRPYIKLDSYKSAHFEEPIAVIGDMKQYRPMGWSSYA